MLKKFNLYITLLLFNLNITFFHLNITSKMVPTLKGKSYVGLFSYCKSSRQAFPYLPCHFVSPEVIFKETQR